MKCMFCGEEMEENAGECPACGMPVPVDTEEVIKKICPNCKAENGNESRFCNKCGWDFEQKQTAKKLCPKCGIELDDDVKFCHKCGYDLLKSGGKKRKKKLPLIIVIVLIVVIAGGGTAYYLHQKAVYEAEQEAIREAERQRQELIKAYELKAVELNDEINAAQTNFYLLSTMFDTSTDLNSGLLGPSFFTSYAHGLCASEINEEKNRKRDIDNLFEELNAFECEEAEVQELKEAIEDYYYSYTERYDLLVEMNFSTYTFSSLDAASKSDFDTKGSAVKEIIQDLNLEVETEN